jgi:hypothetical protein
MDLLLVPGRKETRKKYRNTKKDEPRERKVGLLPCVQIIFGCINHRKHH